MQGERRPAAAVEAPSERVRASFRNIGRIRKLTNRYSSRANVACQEWLNEPHSLPECSALAPRADGTPSLGALYRGYRHPHYVAQWARPTAAQA